jgi:hypothetical protein
MSPRLPLACLLAGCLLAPGAAGAQGRTICPEYRDPLPAGTPRPPERAGFKPTIELPTPRSAALVRSVADLFTRLRPSVQPRGVLQEVEFAASVTVNALRNEYEGAGWQERVTVAQIARVEHFRDLLRGIERGEKTWHDFVGELRNVSPRLLLSCAETFRGRRMEVVGDVHWQRAQRPPRGVVRLILSDGGVRIPLAWAGTGPVADIDRPLFDRYPGVGSWWRVTLERANGGNVLYLRDFLGIKGRTDPATRVNRPPEANPDTIMTTPP